MPSQPATIALVRPEDRALLRSTPSADRTPGHSRGRRQLWRPRYPRVMSWPQSDKPPLRGRSPKSGKNPPPATPVGHMSLSPGLRGAGGCIPGACAPGKTPPPFQGGTIHFRAQLLLAPGMREANECRTGTRQVTVTGFKGLCHRVVWRICRVLASVSRYICRRYARGRR
jgi:hypothetical protein